MFLLSDSSVLLIIDMQRDFVLPGAPAEISGTMEVVPSVQKTVSFYRKLNLPIVHVVRLYLADGSNADLCRRKIIQEGKKIVNPGTLGSELLDELKPSSSVRLLPDLLLKGSFQQIGDKEWILYKPRWGAFYSTRLENHLRQLKIETTVIVGCNFPNCPRATIYEASERDFNVVMVQDAVSGLYNQGVQELKNIGVTFISAADFCF